MKKSFLLLALISLTLVGCGSQTPKADRDHTSDNNLKPIERTKKKIVTSFYPLAFMTEQIVGDKAEVINIAGNANVHEYEPSPQDMVKLTTADLVIFQGAELEPWTDGVVEKLEAVTLEVSHDLDLEKMEEHDDHDKHETEDHHEDEHQEDEETHHKEEAEHDKHNHGEFDPHTWLDPVLAQQMGEVILGALVKADSANAENYKTNAATLNKKFMKLDQSFRENLAECKNQEVIVSHDAFGYLADRYDFEVHSIAGLSTNDEPSAKILAELKEEAEEGITHILVEENNIQRFADTLALETGLETLPVNPLGRGTLDPQKDFFDIMEENLKSFKTALNCQ